MIAATSLYNMAGWVSISELIKMRVKGGETVTLAERRKAAGLTQEVVAKRLDVDQGSISNWERGIYIPHRKYRKKLARLYGCTVDELFPKQ